MKTVLITGGTRGIGKATAQVFASHGYNLILTYNKNAKQAQELKKELESNLVSVLLVKTDMSCEEDINNLVSLSSKQFDTIDCLVNNAGIAIDTLIEDKTKSNFLKTLDVNLIGPFLLSRAIGDKMKEKGHGVIINIASTNGLDTPYPESLDYDASKAGLISLTHNLAQYYSPILRVLAVAPGWVETEMNQNLSLDFRKNSENKILLERFADPCEIAKVIYFLASDDASYIMDTVIRVDGGVKR